MMSSLTKIIDNVTRDNGCHELETKSSENIYVIIHPTMQRFRS